MARCARSTGGIGAAALAVAVAAAVTACGGGGAPRGAFEVDPEEAVIVVDNENTAISEMTIYLVPASGVRKRLGTVTLDRRETFRVAEANWGGGFRLVGDPAGRGQVVSRPFELARGNVIEWEVSRNRLYYAGRSGGG